MIKIEPFLTFDKDLSKLCGNWKKDPRTDLQELSTKFSEQYQLDKSSIKKLYNDVYEYNNKEFNGCPIQLNVNYEIFICKLISKIDSSELFLYYTIYNKILFKLFKSYLYILKTRFLKARSIKAVLLPFCRLFYTNFGSSTLLLHRIWVIFFFWI